MSRAHGKRIARGIALAAAGTSLMLALPMGAAAAADGAAAASDCGPISVAYVEVNRHDIGNVASYTLEDGSNAFDVAIIFASTIDYDGSEARLFFNENVRRTLDDRGTLRRLQARGVKVTLSILGKHKGVGLANFPSEAAAARFADQVAAAVKKYGLDGVDLDDEYADYGIDGTPQPHDDSIRWVVSALRERMPDKIISFYNIGPSRDALERSTAEIGAQLTYAANPYYGTYEVPMIPGIDASRLSPAAVNLQRTPQDVAVSLAGRTMADGYGVFMTYNLTGEDRSGYISAFTQELYGMDAIYTAHPSEHGVVRGSGCRVEIVDGKLEQAG